MGDKISELELQVEPLRKQAETAKKYLVIRDELRGLEISLWMDALDRLAEQTRLLAQDYDAAGEQLRTEKEKLEELYRVSEACSEGIRQADEQAEQLRNEIGELESRASALSHDADLLDAEEKSNLAALERLEQEDDRQHERVEELNTRLRERQNRLLELEEERQGILREQEALFQSSSKTSLEADQAQSDLDRLTARAAEEENAAAAEEARLETIRASAKALEEGGSGTACPAGFRRNGPL